MKLPAQNHWGEMCAEHFACGQNAVSIAAGLPGSREAGPGMPGRQGGQGALPPRAPPLLCLLPFPQDFSSLSARILRALNVSTNPGSGKASQSFSPRKAKKKVQSVFSGDMRLGKNTSQPANVQIGLLRGQFVRCSGLHSPCRQRPNGLCLQADCPPKRRAGTLTFFL